VRDEEMKPLNNINIYNLPTKFETTTYRNNFAPQALKS
jgi:hypothetical protein